MTFLRSTRLLATAVLGAALTLTASPAHAATFVHDDAVGDVRSKELSDTGRLTVDALERAADITQLRVRHGRSRLIMRLETVALTRRSDELVGPRFLVRTPDRLFIAFAFADTVGGPTREAYLGLGNGKRVRCPGLFTDLDFPGNVSMMSIPRSCLGQPRSVTIKATMEKFVIGSREVSTKVDSAMDDGRFRSVGSTPSIRSGPRRGR